MLSELKNYILDKSSVGMQSGCELAIIFTSFDNEHDCNFLVRNIEGNTHSKKRHIAISRYIYFRFVQLLH